MPVRWVLACALACATFGCDHDELEGQLAPGCTEDRGCPEGTQCVDGLFCEAIPGAPIAFDQPRSPITGTTDPGGQGPRPRDGGALDQDGGVVDDGGLRDRDGGDLVAGECTEGTTLCGEQCVDLESDVGNCGACGVACPAAGTCRSGICCNAIEVVCGDRCVDVERDPRNCGVCGRDCGTGECLLGTCQPPIEGPGLPPGNPPFGG